MEPLTSSERFFTQIESDLATSDDIPEHAQCVSIMKYVQADYERLQFQDAQTATRIASRTFVNPQPPRMLSQLLL